MGRRWAGTVLLVAAALGRDMLMAAPGTWEVLRFYFSGGGQGRLSGDAKPDLVVAWTSMDVRLVPGVAGHPPQLCH